LEQALPYEVVLRCLTWMPGPSGHFVTCTTCRQFRDVANDDSIWVGRLRQDFPRVCLRSKPPGSLWSAYKILTKALRQHKAELADKDPRDSWWRVVAARKEPHATETLAMRAGLLHLKHAYASAPRLAACARDAAAVAQQRLGAHVSVTCLQFGTRRQFIPMHVSERAMHDFMVSRREEPRQLGAVLEAEGGVGKAVASFEASNGGFGVTTPRARANSLPVMKPASSPAEVSVIPSQQQLQEDELLAVIQCIQHADSAAQIDEREAAQIVALQHADFVERNLDRMPYEAAVDGCSEYLEDHVMMGKLNRIPKDLREEFVHGPSLRACRAALEEEGYSWKLFSGALVFVHPWQYRETMLALSGFDLRPYHLVFAASLGYLVEEALGRCKGTWLTSRSVIKEGLEGASQLGIVSAAAESVGDDDYILKFEGGGGDTTKLAVEEEDVADWILCVQRTFLCVLSQHSVQPPCTASTTVARCPNVRNPRRPASEI